jgi:hypothetical protein
LLPVRPVPQHVELPMQIRGLKEDELLHVDRTEIVISDRAGRRIYEGAGDNEPTVQGLPSLPDGTPRVQSLVQAFDVPARRDRLFGTAIRLEMHQSLTLLHVNARFAIAAVGGELQAPAIGGCATRLGQGGDTIEFGCVQLKHRPICLSATLYGPEGKRNPEVLKCDLDYRPYLPAPTDALTLYGAQVPVRDSGVHDAVDPGQLSRSYLLIKTFTVREHFTRSAVLSHVQLTNYIVSGHFPSGAVDE